MTRELTGRHVLLILVATFGTIFAVNGVFAYFAVTAYPGLETRDAYRKGVNFNGQIEQAEALKTLGWTLQVEQTGETAIRLRFQDASGAALRVSAVAATLFHPTTEKGDKPLIVSESASGAHIAPIGHSDKGQRQLRVEASGPDGRRITFRRAIWLD